MHLVDKKFPNYHDSYIPFPRTSGAKFCSVGVLVCFGRSFYSQNKNGLNNNFGNEVHFMQIYPDAMSSNSFYFQQQRLRARKTTKLNRPYKNKNQHSIITIYDVSSLFLVSKELAEKYM